MVHWLFKQNVHKKTNDLMKKKFFPTLRFLLFPPLVSVNGTFIDEKFKFKFC